MAERDFSEIARLSERYNKDPQSRIFVQLADAYRKSNMIDEALDILNKGLEYHPDYALGHLILGKCRFDKRLFAQAKESFDRTLELDPQNIVALRMLAQTCENLKDEAGQIAAYKGILAHDPFDTTAKEKLAHLEALHKKQPLYTLSMAQEYEQQGDLGKALEMYEHLLATDPSDIVLKQKATQLRENLSIDKKKDEEVKVAELQLESYFQPADLTKHPATAAPEVETKAKTAPEDTAVSPKQAVPEKESPTAKPVPSAEKEAVVPPEEILPLEDFLTETPAEKTPTVKGPGEPSSGKPATQAPTEPPHAATSDLDILQPFAPESPGEGADKLDIVQPIEATEGVGSEGLELEEIPGQETVRPQPDTPLPDIKEGARPEIPEKKEPEPAAPAVPREEPAIPTKETPVETEDMSDLLQQIETPQEEKVPEPRPVEKAPPTPPPAQPEIETQAPIAEKDRLPETPTPPPAPPEDTKQKPTKPKEEDFQSFQDWLSGLLK